jgi:hypothetical protein
MIDQETYLDPNVSRNIQILAAFSPVDKSVFAALGTSERTQAFHDILFRLSTLCLLHGKTAPEEFAKLCFFAEPRFLVQSLSQFLMWGSAPLHAHFAHSPPHLSNRELQQEIVHFSRIVDLDWLHGAAIRKRIRRSLRIKEKTKFTAELLLVARSRGVNAGLISPPNFAAPQSIREGKTNNGYAICGYVGNAPFYFTFLAKSNQTNKRYAHLARMLLEFLTPREAAYVIAYQTAIVDEARDGFLMISKGGSEAWDVICFGKAQTTQIRPRTAPDPADGARAASTYTDPDYLWLVGALPVERQVAAGEYLSVLAAESSSSLLISLGAETIDIDGFDREHAVTRQTSQGAFRLSAPDLNEVCDALLAWADKSNPVIGSLECGHVHLDRLIDEDQHVGIRIGVELASEMELRFGRRVPLIPLVDDDHVSCVSKPSDLTNAFGRLLDESALRELRIIPESSPVIKAINDCIFEEVILGRPFADTFEVGGNLYLRLDQDTVVEIFEDYRGSAGGERTTGCVFFEVALLVYRTNPDLFDRILSDSQNKCGNIHQKILAILSSEASLEDKLQEARRSYNDYSLSVDWDVAKVDLSAALRQILLTPVLHINVLEAYYQSQQTRVRKMLKALSIPITLVSVFFDRYTDRIYVEA